MDPSTHTDKVIKQNMPSPNNHLHIEGEVIDKINDGDDDDVFSKTDDYGYEMDPFNDNIVRQLSAKLENPDYLNDVNEAFATLESCFIENNILDKNGYSKFADKTKEIKFLNYHDIDNAFSDMIVKPFVNNVKQANKPIDLKCFKDANFCVNSKGIPLGCCQNISDSEETYSHCNESFESEVTTLKVDEGEKDNAIQDIKNINEIEFKSLEISNASTSVECSTIEVKKESQWVENISDMDVRDIRIVVEKLPCEFSDDIAITENDDEIASVKSKTNLIPIYPSKFKQVARKKTGGVVLNSNNLKEVTKEQNLILSSKDGEFNSNNLKDVTKEQKIINQLSSKDGEFIPSVFDKMTRAGKRDLERVIAESTANLVIQKTTQLISEKIKEIQDHKSDNENCSSDDESKDCDIHKTAEMVTNTILEFLTKNKSKKLDKIGKEVTEEIARKLNNFAQENESINSVKDDNVSNLSNIDPVPESSNIENQDTTLKTGNMEEEDNFRRITREASRRKNIKKNSPNLTSTHKLSADALEQIAKVSKDIINIEDNAEVIDNYVEFQEIRRPETRLSKLKQVEQLKVINDLVLANKGEKQPVKSKKKKSSKSRTKKRIISRNRDARNVTNLDKNGSYIDGQFLIDSELTEDSSFRLSDSDLSEASKNADINDDSSEKSESLIKENNITENSDEKQELLDYNSKINNTTFESIRFVTENKFPNSKLENLDNKNDSDKTETLQCNIDGNITETPSKIATSGSCLKEKSSIQGNNKIGKQNEIVDSNLENVNSEQTKNLSTDVDNSKQDKKLEESQEVSEVSHVLENERNSMEKKAVCLEEDSLNKKQAENISSSDQTVIKEMICEKQNEECNKEGQESNKTLSPTILFGEKSQSAVPSEETNRIETIHVKDTNKEICDESVSTKTFHIQVSTNICPKDNASDHSFTSIDSTSFLNYSIDDSFPLMIDESTPSKGQIEMKKDHPEHSSVESNKKVIVEKGIVKEKSNVEISQSNLTKEQSTGTNVSNSSVEIKDSLEQKVQNKNEITGNKSDTSKKDISVSLTETINRKEPESFKTEQESIQQETKIISINKQLTNEEKIAQLTKRDPRLINDKKLVNVNVMLRDPRIRNKFPKVEEEKKTSDVSDSSPLVEAEDEKRKPEVDNRKTETDKRKPELDKRKMESENKESDKMTSICAPSMKMNSVTEGEKDNEDKGIIIQHDTESELDNLESNKKKKLKKEVDEELLYKTPLSDLHNSNNERPSYVRNVKKKKPALSTWKEKEPNEENNHLSQRRNQSYDEVNEEREGYHQKRENVCDDENINHDKYDGRERYNIEEENHRLENRNYFEERNFHPADRERVFPSGSREDYNHQGGYARRVQHEENSRDLPDNQFYSRREFYRRNKFAHDHDHFSSSSRFMDRRQENNYYPQQDTFAIPSESVFRASAYPPVPLLPDPMYNQEEEFDQSYSNMETDSFSPPSSDMCPPPPLIRSPSPELGRRDHFCPSPPRIGRDNSPPDLYLEYNRNVERDFRGRGGGGNNRPNFSRDTVNNRFTRTGNFRRGNGSRDYRWQEESPPRKRFTNERGREDDRRRWRRSPSWSPDRQARRWSRERSLSPPPTTTIGPWDSPRRSPSPPRWRDYYRERNLPPYKNYRRYD